MAKYKKRVPKSNKRYLNHGGPHGADGNPIIEQNPFGSGSNYLGEDSNSGVYSNPDAESESSGPSAGQYAAAGTALAAGSANSYKTFQDPNSSIRDKSTSFDGAVTGTASAINPLVGSVIGVANSFGAGRRDKNEAMTEGTAGAPPKLVDEKSARRGAIVGSWFSPSKAIATRGSYEGGFTDFTGKGYTAALNKEAKDAWDLANPKVVVDNKDYEQDTAYQKLNNLSQQKYGGNMYRMGGDMLTQYDGGFKHDDSNPMNVNQGIPVGDKNVVEKGETRAKDYIYSDTLKKGKYTYAALSKKLGGKFRREGDKMEMAQKELELSNLAKEQELHRENIMERAHKRAYGESMSKYGGGLNRSEDYGSKEKPYPSVQSNDFASGDRSYPIPTKDDAIDALRLAGLHGRGDVRSKVFAKYPDLKKELWGGGKLDPVNPNYQTDSMNTVNYAASRPELYDPNRMQWSTNMAGDVLYKQPVINDKVGRKIPVPFGKNMPEEQTRAIKWTMNEQSKKANPDQPLPYQNLFGVAPRKMGGKMYYAPGGPLQYDKSGKLIGDTGGYSTPEGTFDSQGNKLANPYGEYESGASANEQAYARYKADLGEPIGSWTDMDYRGKENARLAGVNPDGSPISQDNTLASTTPGVTAPTTDTTGNKFYNERGFDSNRLYNTGNFMAGLYDIYRGSKGGDAVNYERVNPDLVKPELVNYEASRNLQRRDIGEGFRNTQEQLRNINNPAEYRASLIQTAGQRDKLMSDSTAKSFENELNTNATIKGRANEFNAGAKNQGKYFNASTQRAEADARQMEKDEASNTLQRGLSQTGEAIAGTGRDRAYRVSQEDAKKYLGTGEFKPAYDDKGKEVKGYYRHAATNKLYKIG